MSKGKVNRMLDGVAIRTDPTGRFCGVTCPFLVYVNGTCCALEADKAKAGLLRSRYDKAAGLYGRCPLCLRRERKAGSETITFNEGC